MTISFDDGDINIRKKGGNGVLESVADYFMFWIYGAIIGTSERADIARAFLSGDEVIVWRRQGGPEGTHIVVTNDQAEIVQAVLSITAFATLQDFIDSCGSIIPYPIPQGVPFANKIGSGHRCEFAIILSRGMTYWLTKLARSTTGR